jgi:hypothetical protein
MIPCAIVLALGYRAIAKPPANRAFARCARIVAVVGAGWIGAALVIDAVLGFFHLNPFKLYSASDAFADMRFYLGWTLGLLLTPYAAREATGPATGHEAKKPRCRRASGGKLPRRRFGVTSVATTGCDPGSAVEKLGFRPAEMAAWPARNSDHRLEARGLHHDSLGEAVRHHHGKSGGAAHRARLSPGGRRADDHPGRLPGSQHRR